MLRRFFSRVLTVLIWFALASCGGGGSDTGTPPWDGGGGGGGGGTTPTATDMELVLSSAQILNLPSKTITATVTTVDSNRNVVAAVPVTFSVDQGAVITPSATSTDSKGVVTADVNIGSNRSNRIVTITAKAGSLVKTRTFIVTGTTISATLIPTVVSGSVNKVIYAIKDANGDPIVGESVSVTLGSVISSAGVTDANGVYEFSYTAPSTVGSLTLIATAAGVQDTQVITVNSGAVGSIPDAAIDVVAASLSANPNVVATNTENSNNQVELRALFVGANNKPVENIRVRFYLPDPNSIGGEITTGDSMFYSSANGIVVGAYKPSSRSSPTDGVVVRACWAKKDFPVSATKNCPVDANGVEQKVEATLTVASEPLGVSIGTNDLLTVEDSSLTYVQKFAVMVVDAAGMPKADVTLSVVLDLLAYGKGEFEYKPDKTIWEKVLWAISCEAEDTDRNGSLDLHEDFNGNGQLDPRKADVSVSFLGANVETGKTDQNGLAILQIRYPRNVASWVTYRLTVRAKVLGSEGETRYDGVLKYLATDAKDENAPPAFAVSPYGKATSCSNPQ